MTYTYVYRQSNKINNTFGSLSAFGTAENALSADMCYNNDLIYVCSII